MKFRAIINDNEMGQYFIRILSSMCRLSSSVVMRLSSQDINIFASCRKFSQMKSCCQLINETYFADMKFKGVCEEHNLIYIELKSDVLNQTLHSIHFNVLNMREMKLKLTNRPEGPSLSFFVDYDSFDANRCIRHDVSISVIQRNDWHEYQDPELGPFHASLVLPQFKLINSTVDRLSNMSPTALLSATMDANRWSFIISIRTDSVELKSRFNNMELHLAGMDENEPRQEGAQVRIDTRVLHTIFTALNPIKLDRIVCNLIHEQLVHFVFFHPHVTFQSTLANVEF